MSKMTSPLRDRLSRRTALAGGLGALLLPAIASAEEPVAQQALGGAPAPTEGTRAGDLSLRLKVTSHTKGLKLTLYVLNHTSTALRVAHTQNGVPLPPESKIVVAGRDSDTFYWRSEMSRLGLRSRVMRTGYANLAAADDGTPGRMLWGTFETPWPQDVDRLTKDMTLLTRLRIMVHDSPRRYADLSERTALLPGTAALAVMRKKS